MASYVGLVKVIITLIVAFFAVLFNIISHVFNYLDGLRFPEKPVAPRRRRPQAPPAFVNRQQANDLINNVEVEDDDSEDVAETASRRL
ncbi:unnamed protein product [Orchesella dallaii]|uniref:Uncharacterized protein n=1 Tax=Orchesella dallaii TaxID=48710 RepID=A0ABP1Q7W1_9HEXA